MATVDRQKLYDCASDYFDLAGSAVMKLTRNAAIDVCHAAAARGLLVVRIEGGIKRENAFEARLDAIWSGTDPPVNRDVAERNNSRAADFIRSQITSYNAFIITDTPLTGWRYRDAAHAAVRD